MKPTAIKTINLLLALMIGALLSLGAVTLYLDASINDKVASKPSHFTPDNLKFVQGSGEISGKGFSVSSLTNGMAVVSSGRTQLSAETYPVLKYSLATNHSAKPPVFFGRSTHNPKVFMRIPLQEDNTGIVALNAHPEWSGQIIEIGFLFEGEDDNAFKVEHFSLEQTSLSNHWLLLINQWLQFEPWRQGSVNFAWGGAKQQDPPLPLVVIIWVAFSILAFALSTKLSRQPWRWAAILIILACGWLLLDARWLFNTATQMHASRQAYAGLDEREKLARGLDAHIFAGMQKLKQKILPQTPVKIILLSNPETQLYYALRTRYHLAPHMVYSTHQLPAKKQLHAGQYLLVVGKISELSYSHFRNEITWNNNTRIPATRVHRGAYGQLFLLQ